MHTGVYMDVSAYMYLKMKENYTNRYSFCLCFKKRK